MLDYEDYTIDEDAYQGNGNGYHGNGYDHLNGDWAVFYKVAKGFLRRSRSRSGRQFLQRIPD